MSKELHEDFTKFFEAPDRETFRRLIKNNIGEMDHLDFKESLPEMHKLAKHILALANYGGGVIVSGIKEEDGLKVVGVAKIIDKAEIDKGVKNYLPKTLKYYVLDFTYKDSEYGDLKGKSFQVIIVESNDFELPYLCLKQGKDLKSGAVYIRQGTSSVEAKHDDMQSIITKRIDTQYSNTGDIDLNEHLNQLKSLYLQIPKETPSSRLAQALAKQIPFGSISELGQAMLSQYGETDIEPIEKYEDFIKRVINEKKERIREFLDLK